MSSPYGPPAGGFPHWGQQPPPPNTGMPPSGPGFPPQAGFTPQPPPPQYGHAPQHQPAYPPPSAPVPPQGGFGPPPRKKRRVLPWLLGGAGVVVVAAVLVLGFVAPGWFVRTVFDASSVEKGVEQTLKGSYRLSGVGPVVCPSGQPVEVGSHFDCQVRIGGETKTVTVTVKTDEGVYEVGHPG